MELLQEIKFIVIHHCEREIDSPELIKERHLKRGWEDIGYHYLIGNKSDLTEDGKIYKGRDEKFIGAHVLGHNRNSISICLIGKLDKNPPTEKQIKTLINFLKEKIKKHKLLVKNVLGHNEFPNVTKTCPGKFLEMNKIRELISKEQT